MSDRKQADSLDGKVALVTGAGKRLGASTARHLHAMGCNVAVHCFRSEAEANELADELNRARPHSAVVVVTKLGRRAEAEFVVERTLARWQRLDVVVNNASSFFPTPLGDISDENFDNLIFSNLSAPLFVAQAASNHLKKTSGCVINMIDIHANKPHPLHSVYCAAKSALASLTRSLAIEMAPEVRVNGVAPGVILWPEVSGTADANQMDANQMTEVLNAIPLQQQGHVDDIANTILFLVGSSARYITGQIITVDGGKSLC